MALAQPDHHLARSAIDLFAWAPPEKSKEQPRNNVWNNSPIAELLEERSLDIFRSFNEHDAATAYERYASSDFAYTYEIRPGNLEPDMDAHEAMTFMRDVVYKHPEHYAEIMNLSVQLYDDLGLAVVWKTLSIHDRHDGFMPDTEKISCFHWRMRKDGDWEWYAHFCLCAMPPILD